MNDLYIEKYKEKGRTGFIIWYKNSHKKEPSNDLLDNLSIKCDKLPFWQRIVDFFT